MNTQDRAENGCGTSKILNRLCCLGRRLKIIDGQGRTLDTNLVLLASIYIQVGTQDSVVMNSTIKVGATKWLMV